MNLVIKKPLRTLLLLLACAAELPGIAGELVPLEIIVSGAGTVTGVRHRQPLEVGRTYRVVATPSAGYLFSRWTIFDAIVPPERRITSTSRNFQFVMRDTILLIAEFVPDPTLRFAGEFRGLFMPEGSLESMYPTNSGGLLVAVARHGAFSGRVSQQGRTYPFSGRLNSEGQAMVTVNRNLMEVPWELQLQIIDGPTQYAEGQINGEGWRSPFHLDRGRRSTHWPGQQRLRLTPLSDLPSDTVPPGFGFSLMRTDRKAQIRTLGRLPDGTPFAAGTVMGIHGNWHTYIPLYAGKGFLLGSYETGGTSPDGNGNSLATGGLLFWRKPSGGQWYPSGLATAVDAYGGSTTAPAGTLESPVWTNSLLRLEGGDLPSPVAARTFLINNQLLALDFTNGTFLRLDPSTGLIRGSFVHPASQTRVQVRGVVVPSLDSCYGYFLGPNQGGSFTIEQQWSPP